MTIRRRLLCACVPLLVGTAAAFADPSPEPSPTPDRAALEIELRGLQSNLEASQAERRKIEADVESIKLDRARLNQALLETTAKIQKAEGDRADAVQRFSAAIRESKSLEASVAQRRARLADLLAALQRIGADAPPALLVRPDDMAEAVRAASVLNSVIADIKAEADRMSRDLTRVSQLKTDIARERDGLSASAQTLAVDRERLAALVDARQKALADRTGALAAERKRADELAGKASGLKDLIGRMDGDAAAAAAADQAAAAAVESRAAAPGGELARLRPAEPFSELKGRVDFPVAGSQIKNFGDPDGAGGQEKGVSIATPPGATVSTPVDAWVGYAGVYRSYGQLLILNVGEGYYLVIAGMEHIQVSVGQFVLAGEPIGVMGQGASRAASNAAIGVDPPVLYIELRKNDAVIDPQPWWSKPNLEKARG